jgi:acyl-CoA reductase-like NAD-dependent aldehyde dehydrogenase
VAPQPLIRDPRTGLPERALAPLDAAGVAAAATELRAAQPEWAALPAAARAQALAALADAMDAHAEAIVSALARDTGRARIARVEFEAITAAIRRWAARAPAILAEAETAGQAAIPSISYTTRLVPYGLVGVISPWNFPLLLALTERSRRSRRLRAL